MHAWCFYDFMYTLKVLFKLNSVPCRASWYMTKKILVNPLACNIFYTKKKKKKNPMLKALLSLSLEVDENDIWFSKNEQNWTL